MRRASCHHASRLGAPEQFMTNRSQGVAASRTVYGSLIVTQTPAGAELFRCLASVMVVEVAKWTVERAWKHAISGEA